MLLMASCSAYTCTSARTDCMTSHTEIVAHTFLCLVSLCVQIACYNRSIWWRSQHSLYSIVMFMHQAEACFSAVQSHATQALIDSDSLLYSLDKTVCKWSVGPSWPVQPCILFDYLIAAMSSVTFPWRRCWRSTNKRGPKEQSWSQGYAVDSSPSTHTCSAVFLLYCMLQKGNTSCASEAASVDDQLPWLHCLWAFGVFSMLKMAMPCESGLASCLLGLCAHLSLLRLRGNLSVSVNAGWGPQQIWSGRHGRLSACWALCREAKGQQHTLSVGLWRISLICIQSLVVPNKTNTTSCEAVCAADVLMHSMPPHVWSVLQARVMFCQTARSHEYAGP